MAPIVVAAFATVFFVTAVPSVAAHSSVRRLPELATATEGQKVLVFAPHPDDETIAVGGYIAQSIKNGADVRIVVVTDGNKYHRGTVRYSEFKIATGILGVRQANLVFLGFPDGRLTSENQTTFQATVRSQIDLYQPDIVIYPHPGDYNPDHATVGRAVDAVLDKKPFEVAKYEYVVHYQLIYPRPRKFDPKLYLLPPTRLTRLDTEWLKVPLSQEVEDLKEKAILTYHSQFSSPELNGLLHSFVRRNELLEIPKS